MYVVFRCFVRCVYLHVCKPDIADRNRNYHTATGNHMPYEITQCYLPPGRGDFPAFTPAEAGLYVLCCPSSVSAAPVAK